MRHSAARGHGRPTPGCSPAVRWLASATPPKALPAGHAVAVWWEFLKTADAARRLFATHGYGATSMETIAGETGVAVRTIYAAFGAKREILSLICERWLEEAGARELAGEL